MMKKWNVSLLLFAFILVIFGTFLTRSGVLSSVHTYSEKGIGVYFIVFLALLVVSSISLLLLRNKELSSESDMKTLLSREGMFLLTNLLFVLATAVIFVGTIFPGISEAIRGTKIDVGPSFFNQVNGRFGIPEFAGLDLFEGDSVVAQISTYVWSLEYQCSL